MTTSLTLRQLQSNKSALHETRVVSSPLPELGPGEALLRINRLALGSLSSRG